MKRQTRADSQVVKQIIQSNGCVDAARHLMELPLIYIERETLVSIGEFAANRLDSLYGNIKRPFAFYSQKAHELFNEHGFNCVFYIDPMYFSLEYYPDDNTFKYTIFERVDDTYAYSFSFLVHENNTAHMFLDRDMYAFLSDEMFIKYRNKIDEENKKDGFLNDPIKHAITAALSIYTWLDNCDKRPVAVRNISSTPEKKKQKQRKLKPWLDEESVSIEFLDELPIERQRGPSQGGTHAPPRPHHRRGHFRTLTSEKYCHHPLFGVHKGVYVKAAFIGPTTTTCRGKEYRLCRPNRQKNAPLQRS